MRVDLGELEGAARERLSPAVFDYIAAGGGDEHTLAANVHGWEQLTLRPHVLRDVSALDTSVDVLGARLALPVLVAPTAGQALVNPEADVATARAAAAAGTVMAVSMTSGVAIEEIAAGAPDARLWMHVTMLADRGRTRALCERAKAAGCRAIVLTVDCPVGAVRPRSQRHGGEGLPGAQLPNLTMPGETMNGDVMAMVAGFDRAVTFDDIDLVRQWSQLPVVVKGVLRGDDALQCAQAGAAAIVVSNHGGRQLDQCVSTADALVDVVGALGGTNDGGIEVLVDGGIRRGVHVLAALALGATATLIGRLPVYGLAIGGEQGVRDVLEQIAEELAAAMALCGVDSVGAIGSDLLRS